MIKNIRSIIDIIFRKKVYFLILSIKDGCNITDICKKSDFTFSYGYDVVIKLQKEGFLNLKREGRELHISLTEIGKKLQNCLIEIDKLFPKKRLKNKNKKEGELE